jgi:spore coat polysaccharide biosynthesis predicted glycosyltransferase SpsG
MAELMRDADLALGAAGSTAWERCCMGLPTMQVALADNQRHIAKALTDHGAAVWVERHHWANAVGTACATLLIRPEAMIAMSKAAAAVTDGLGANRVARSLSRGVVT